jgi:hypothetical protein
VREIGFSVAGYPPAKNEAKSMLAAGHMYADRVLVLLQAARGAVGDAAQPLSGVSRWASSSSSRRRPIRLRTRRTTWAG